MAAEGYSVIGVDAARRLLREARRSGVVCTAADAAALPFGDESLDYVFTVGVLHHLPGAAIQAAACREAWRVLKRGGVFVVQETNTRNPLFRLYMSYLFPLLKSIDEGTELWIEPERWTDVPGFDLRDTIFFTFLPDFAPRFALPVLRSIERRLERGRLKSRSVHYQAVLRKSETSSASSPLFGEPAGG
jgi:SAM-dependent methyltransferase